MPSSGYFARSRRRPPRCNRCAPGCERRGVEALDVGRVRRASSAPAGRGRPGSRRSIVFISAASSRGTISHSGCAIDDVLARGGSSTALETRLTATQAWTRRPAACAPRWTVASGSKSPAGAGARRRAARCRRVIRVAAAAHLHEQRVEAVFARRSNERGDAPARSSDVRSTQIARVSAAAPVAARPPDAPAIVRPIGSAPRHTATSASPAQRRSEDPRARMNRQMLPVAAIPFNPRAQG